MTNLPKIALGAWAWGNDGTFGINYAEEELKEEIADKLEISTIRMWEKNEIIIV